VRRDLITAAAVGTLADAQAALDGTVEQLSRDERPVVSKPGEAFVLYLDLPGYPEWAPLTFDGTTYRLALAPGIGIEPSTTRRPPS
jgi:hypothetical protein